MLPFHGNLRYIIIHSKYRYCKLYREMITFNRYYYFYYFTININYGESCLETPALFFSQFFWYYQLSSQNSKKGAAS